MGSLCFHIYNSIIKFVNLSILSHPVTCQPAIIARSPWRLLRSAGSFQWPRQPAVVQLHASGATGPGEPPHPSPPGQGRLHRQTTSGGGWGRRGWGWSGRGGLAVILFSSWTVIRGLLVCLLPPFLTLLPPPHWLAGFPLLRGVFKKVVVKGSPNLIDSYGGRRRDSSSL